MNPNLDQEFAEDKWSILDILARDDHGRWLNIEMQTSLPAALAERLGFLRRVAIGWATSRGRIVPGTGPGDRNLRHQWGAVRQLPRPSSRLSITVEGSRSRPFGSPSDSPDRVAEVRTAGQ